MSRFPGLYPVSVAVLAGLAGWMAYGLGKGPSPASQVAATLPKQPPAHAGPGTPPSRDARQPLDLPAEIARLCQLDTEHFYQWQRLEEWEKIRSLSIPQVKEALQLIAATDAKFSTRLLKEMLYARWAELDPEEAMAAVAAHKGEQALGSSALWTWVQRDPEAAQRWQEKNGELAAQLGMNGMLAELLLKEEPAIALEKATHLGKDVRARILAYLPALMVETGDSRAEFRRILDTLPNDERKRLRDLFARSWCGFDPESGLAGLSELIPDKPQQDSVRDYTLKRWGARLPAEALAWMKEHPEESNPGQQAYVWREWVEVRPQDAMEWLKSRGPDAELAEAITRHLQSFATSDPFTRPISGQRQAAGLRRSYEIWSRAKPAEAAQWLMSADPKVAATITQAAPTE
ncbi:hypothetical protein [Luteolibacter luteus]|uniref:Uncharacterized protein n=1 Tax=Luteolibacter luteus TaxID=2728835 RepID=A0A858RC66_9BACT|nr:hypothetical protein [Luteolibacter luteus]QJE94312.1 hypothetical protein HHL09_00430 [Luteolibacter luteus]